METIVDKVEAVFLDAFGRTPLRQRIEDIQGEAIELCRYSDFANLKEETGDLLASTIMLCRENEWSPEELIENTLKKIEKRKLQYHGLGRKTKVAILGGAFNPITVGHIKLAQFVLDSSRTFDEVWLSPCYSHMHNKSMESESHRLEMCRIATKSDARIKVFDYEIKNQLKGETYNFVKRLLHEDFAKNEYDFSMIIGMDNANSFSKWVNYEDLERLIRFVVVNRQGVPKNDNVDWYLKSPHIYLASDEEIPNISSTEVRNAFYSFHSENTSELISEFLDKNITPGVKEYIVKNNIYKQS